MEKIVYYKSLFCPRCIPTNRFLKQLRGEYPQIEIEEIEVVTNMKRARAAGVHAIPEMDIAGRRFHGVPPKEEVIRLLGLGGS